MAGYTTGDPRFLLQAPLTDYRAPTRKRAEETLAALTAMPAAAAMARSAPRP